MSIAPKELADAFLLIVRVLSGEDDFDPTRYRLKVLTEGGGVEERSFDDSQLNRIILALQEWCREEPRDKYLSLCWRIFALNELIHQGALNEWVRPDANPAYLAIPGSVIQVAAELPLQGGAGFDPRAFIERIRQICFLE